MKKQNTFLFVITGKKAITSIFFLLGFIIPLKASSCTPIAPFESLLQTPYLYQSVNVITGDYCEGDTDYINPAHPTFKIRRCFSNGEGWVFNLPLKKDAPSENRESTFIYDYNNQDLLTSVHRNNSTTPLIHINYPTPASLGMTLDINGNTLSYEFELVNSRLGVPPFLIKNIRHQDSELFRYFYRPHPYLRKQLLERKEDCRGAYCLNEYYDKKHNDVGDIKIVIDDPVRDPRIGRVKLQKAPVGNDQSPSLQPVIFTILNIPKC